LSQPDLILVGGGLANTLIALRLADTQPSLNVLLLEQDAAIGGTHTWSFHGSDLSPAQHEWLAPVVEHHWDQYEVRFPARKRTLPGTYHSIDSTSFAAHAEKRLGTSIRTGVTVTDIQPTRVSLADGSEIAGGAVIDGRGPAPSPHLDVRFQKFVGQVVQLEHAHGLRGPIVMDATVPQDDGYRFIYTLPFSPDTVLIEDTRYSDGPDISVAEYGQEIEAYADAQGWRIARQLRTEEGVLPITLGGNIEAYWNSAPAPVARAGLQAVLFHPATGYSLPNALRLADELAELGNWSADAVYACTRQRSIALWRQTGFYRVLNRMLFLAAEPQQRMTVLQRFYGLNEGLIARFYAGQSTLPDKLRVLMGKPPVPLGAAMRSVFGYRPPQA
jgi:lycopene beta-cyclase